ncbi:hypothetical protein CYMTET_5220 [Cymbomonas tetramitiformis]|uniref:Uncharacterized protein n=1 Tax=Cymbomonas tetramitiformis TaxID=36881 RepID=A0AAE0GZU8_9CHLO|nr:hypothetical protein CYMTET_5220 [Cymbomonas tetramitiformis]
MLSIFCLWQEAFLADIRVYPAEFRKFYMNEVVEGTDVNHVDPYVYVLRKIFDNSLVVVDFEDVDEVLGDDDLAWRQLSRHCRRFSTVVMGGFPSRSKHATRTCIQDDSAGP